MLQGLGRHLRCCGVNVVILGNENDHEKTAEVSHSISPSPETPLFLYKETDDKEPPLYCLKTILDNPTSLTYMRAHAFTFTHARKHTFFSHIRARTHARSFHTRAHTFSHAHTRTFFSHTHTHTFLRSFHTHVHTHVLFTHARTRAHLFPHAHVLFTRAHIRSFHTHAHTRSFHTRAHARTHVLFTRAPTHVLFTHAHTHARTFFSHARTHTFFSQRAYTHVLLHTHARLHAVTVLRYLTFSPCSLFYV